MICLQISFLEDRLRGMNVQVYEITGIISPNVQNVDTFTTKYRVIEQHCTCSEIPFFLGWHFFIFSTADEFRSLTSPIQRFSTPLLNINRSAFY